MAIVGGGFYGCVIAGYAAERGYTVALVEQGDSLLGRASLVNQARVHNGYHYPRSFTTGWRSHENYARFLTDFEDCVHKGMLGLYAIARLGSKTSARQFDRFCHMIGAPVRPARPALRKVFSAQVETVFEVDEVAFDAIKLRRKFEASLANLGVDVRLESKVVRLDIADSTVSVETDARDVIEASTVINCAYSGANHLDPSARGRIGGLKHELTEMAMIEVPEQLQGLGITVMDGAYFSVFPYPADDLHTLSHVRHTPHAAWVDEDSGGPHPYEVLDRAPRATRFPAMVRDASRYVPALNDARYSHSLFEIKTVPADREVDDARPIMLRQEANGRIVSVLGSKIDNIYDVIPEIDGFLKRSH